MATKKRTTAKKAAKTSTKKRKGIVKPPHPFQTCTDKCYSNLKVCLDRNPGNAQMCLRKFNACVIGCIGPVIHF